MQNLARETPLIYPAAKQVERIVTDQAARTQECDKRVLEVMARLLAAIERKEAPVLTPEDAATLRAAGEAQNRALAECRMAVRELKQAARAVEWDEAATDEVKAQARKIPRGPRRC